MNEIFGNYLQLTLVMKGEINYNQYLDGIIERGKDVKFNFSRLEMIIDIYGHELKPVYKKVLAARDKRNDIEYAHERAYRSGELNAAQYLQPFSEAQIELEELTESLRKQVAEVARNA